MNNDYYVYLHLLEDGTVFYVGKGRGDRAYSKGNRSVKWHNIVSINEYSVTFYKKDLSESDALDCESNLIRTIPNLINRQPSVRRFFTKAEYEICFKIDENSLSFVSRLNEQSKTYSQCGYIMNKDSKKYKPYWVVKFKNKHVLLHHIVWVLSGNKIESNMVIDHIDGDSLNNRIGNLRQITQKQNCKNRAVNTNNTSGIHGVSNTKYGCIAYVDGGGKKNTKRFSAAKHGSQELALKAAQEWRAERIAELNEHGAGYTERHGT